MKLSECPHGVIVGFQPGDEGFMVLGSREYNHIVSTSSEIVMLLPVKKYNGQWQFDLTKRMTVCHRDRTVYVLLQKFSQ